MLLSVSVFTTFGAWLSLIFAKDAIKTYYDKATQLLGGIPETS